MVFTTLNFAEKYLLKTEIRTVASMPSDDYDRRHLTSADESTADRSFNMRDSY